MQVDKILGKTAPPSFINQLRELALKHHDLVSVDVIRAYHFGQRYLVSLLSPATHRVDQTLVVECMIMLCTKPCSQGRCLVSSQYFTLPVV